MFPQEAAVEPTLRFSNRDELDDPGQKRGCARSNRPGKGAVLKKDPEEDKHDSHGISVQFTAMESIAAHRRDQCHADAAGRISHAVIGGFDPVTSLQSAPG